MRMIINPGSTIPVQSGKGWTNTEQGAHREAEKWLANMRSEGITDVELLPGCEPSGEGRWCFTFRHQISGVEVNLVTHGIDDIEAYGKERIFYPRVYWNDSSCAEPEVENFAAEGFEVVKTLRPIGGAA